MTTTITRGMREREVSEQTGIPVTTLRYMRHCGDGPQFYKIGRAVYYDPQDVQDWLQAQKAATSRGGDAA